MPLLNLTEYEESNFDALAAGKYFANVFEIEEKYTKGGPDAALPKGTPMIYVHYQITGKLGEDSGPNEESPYYNRRVFDNMIIPPEGWDAKMAKRWNGNIVQFFRAVGVDEKKLLSGKFEPEYSDYQEAELVIQINRRADKQNEGEFRNNVIKRMSLDEVAAEVGETTSGLL